MGPWHWRLENSDGATVDSVPDVGSRDGFPLQGDAESWIGEHWQVLLEHGVEAVTLMEGDRQVYGPMSLRPE
jgi:hypothetical protein